MRAIPPDPLQNFSDFSYNERNLVRPLFTKSGSGSRQEVPRLCLLFFLSPPGPSSAPTPRGGYPLSPKPEHDPVRYYEGLSPQSRLLLGLVIALNLKDDKRLLGLLNTGDLFPRPAGGKDWILPEVSRLRTGLDFDRWETGSSNRWNQTLTSLALRELFEGPKGPARAKEILGRLNPSHPPADPVYTNFYDPVYIRRLLAAFYARDIKEMESLEKLAKKAYDGYLLTSHFKDHLFWAILPPDWAETIPPPVLADAVSIKISILLGSGILAPDLPDLLPLGRRLLEKISSFQDLAIQFLTLDLVAGHRDGVAHYVETHPKSALFLLLGIQGWEAFLRGDLDSAAALFKKMHTEFRKTVTKRKMPPEEPFGIFYALTLALLDRSDKRREELSRLLSVATPNNTWNHPGYVALSALESSRKGVDGQARGILSRVSPYGDHSPLAGALLAQARHLIDPDKGDKFRDLVLRRFLAYREVLPLVAALYADLLVRLGDPPKAATEALTREPHASFLRPFRSLFQQEAPWERSLAGLEEILAQETPAEESAREKRIAWLFNPKTLEIEAVEQSRKNGVWRGSKKIAFKRLKEADPSLPLAEADRKVVDSFTIEGSYGNRIYYAAHPRATPLALSGHPALFHMSHPEQRLDLVAALPELILSETPEGYRIELSHRADYPRAILEAESPSRYRVVDISPQVLSLAARIPPRGLAIPREARDRILGLLRRQAPFLTLRAEIAEADIPAIEGLSLPVLQLAPFQEGIALTAGVRPFGAGGPFYPAGRGGRLVTAAVDGKTLHARRDLDAEKKRLEELLDDLPVLAGIEPEHNTWILEDPEEALDLLTELRETPLPKEIEWPQGERFRVTPPVDTKKLRITVREAREWFEVDGKVVVDEELVLDLKEILSLLPQARGRYLPLSDGRFLRLEETFRQRLERLSSVSEDSGSGARVSLPGTLAIEELLSEAGEVKGDKTWRDFQKRLREAADHRPQIPTTLTAELRDYQVEGFSWMSRLARWGAGACLADDMGLGKTVQAIAVMLEQASEGPILVVAPTSVCHNWSSELARFAPTLAVHSFREASDRSGKVQAMGPRDVLIASYGLLAQEESLFAGISWRMAVFDEAQAFKNAETKRSQAARKIGAHFRLALTGTPVENDLDELWSLMSVLNPRLLGSRERFAARFAGPIERSRDTRVLAQLRALIRPFMLRRTKSAVLSELPPRTEITLEVELSSEERAFYEALRRTALDRIADLSDRKDSRIHILAEITRLRRALCHPSLVDPETSLPGSKLETFLGLVDELRENRHRALVFSQFTGHLEKVAKALDARKISYQYLDGSTPAKEREKRVEAFQGGTGDLFLISLRAGGTGLNLTAADYVIHLDPWWNPAVEDQASDRAHRIGQQRPVTIYRLIATASIEEKILELHGKKRDLANDLLEGAEMSGKLTNEELIALIG